MSTETLTSTAEALCAQGDSEAKAGRFAEAVQTFEKALAIQPDHLPAHYNLGRVLLVIGQRERQPTYIADALRHLEAALRIDPDFIRALQSKATALALSGRLEEAVNDFHAVLERDADNREAHNWLGEIYKGQGKLDESLQHYRRLAALFPEDLDLRQKFGGILTLKGKHSSDMPTLVEAQQQFKYVLSHQPDDIPALIGLGTAHMMALEFDETFAVFEKAIAVDPNCSEAYYRLGVAYLSYGRYYEKSLAALRKAISLNPDMPGAYVSLAITLEQMNAVKELEEVANIVHERWPNHPQASIPMGRVALRKGELEKAKHCFEHALVAIGDSFGVETILTDLAKIYEKQGDFDKAFEYYFKAQHTTTENIFYKYRDPQQFSHVIVMMRRWFTRIPLDNRHTYTPQKDERPPPVFFVGFPRSGTTLVEQILHSHSDIITGQEEVWIGDIAIRIKRLLAADVPYPGCIFHLNDEQIRNLRDEYWRMVEQTIPPEELNGKTLVDKLPLNMPHLPFIYSIFPDAKIIVAIRDPRDVVLSCFLQVFSPNNGMANFNSLESAAVLYVNIMDLYLQYQECLGIPVFQYRYEDLVKDVESYSRRMLEYIGLPWDDNVLHYYEEKNRRIINTPSYEGVSRPIYSSSVSRWKRFGKFMAPILPVLNPIIERLGYTPEILPEESGAEDAYWVESYCRLADSFAKQEYFEEGIAYFEKALALDPACEEANRNIAKIFLLLGQAHNNKEQLQRAAEHFSEALDADPRNFESNLYAGRAYELTGDTDKALRHLKIAAEMNPDSYEAHYFLSQTFQLQGDLRAALAAIDRVLALQPKWEEAATYKAMLLRRLNA